MPKEVIATDNAPAAIGPYSQAVRAGDMLFASGQLGIDPQTGELVPGCAGCQTRQVLTNVTAVLEAAGMTLDNVVKCSVFLADMADFGKMNGVYEEFFAEPYPARSTFQVAALPKDALVEIEIVAVAG